MFLFQLFLFTSYIPEHRCRVPICDISTNSTTTAAAAVETDFLEFAVPSKHNAKECRLDESLNMITQGLPYLF